jgi:EmrB/QacA subfamily drug resistance transporter
MLLAPEHHAHPDDPPVSAQGPPEPVPRAVWRLGAVIVFGAFTSQLDTSVVNVGLDTIGRDLGAPLEQVQWVSTAYLLALGVSLPVTGWLGRRVGVGRLWLGALTAFTAASGLCALAPSASWLIALRVVQGLTAGVLVPAGQTLLGQAAGPRRLGRVMGVLGVAVSLAPAVGPVVGALVLDAASWPWLFLVNVPVGLAGLLLGLRIVPRGERGVAPDLDWPGLALVSLALPLLVYAATAAGEAATLAAPAVLGPLLVGAAALLAFGLHARRAPEPLLDLGLFRRRPYAAASAAAAATGAAQFGAALLLPLYFQLARDASVLTTGLSLISLGVGTAIMSPLSGRLTDRFGGGSVAVAGSALAVASTLPFAVLPAGADPVLVQALLFVRGLTIALAITPVITAAYATVAPEQLPDATTQVNILLRLGGAVGSAVFAVIVARELPAGAEHALHVAFWWLNAAAIAAFAAATSLWLATRPQPSRRAAAPRTSSPTTTGDPA